MINNQLDIETNNIAIPVMQQLLLFDLKTGGHHGSYIKYLVEYWCKYNISGRLFVVVSPNFIRYHDDVVEIVKDKFNSNISFIAIEENEYNIWERQNNTYLKIICEWNIFCKYAKKLKVSHALIMYFDHFQLPLAIGLKPPCNISGIYFRPTFHYDNFDNYSSTNKDRNRQWRQKMILLATLRNSYLKNCFCLDNFAVEYLQEKFPAESYNKMVYLPDPVDIIQNQSISNKAIEKKQILGIEAKRKVFLLFGRLDSRKGIMQILDAIALLPKKLLSKICILLIGEIPLSNKLEIQNRIDEIKSSLPIQIISVYKFIKDNEIPLYFYLSDIILAPYQRHVGMSGILLLAAAAKKPVLSSDYGLMGKLVQKYHLGISIDSTSSQLIAEGIMKFMNGNYMEYCSFEMIENFAHLHESNHFSQTLINTILNNSK